MGAQALGLLVSNSKCRQTLRDLRKNLLVRAWKVDFSFLYGKDSISAGCSYSAAVFRARDGHDAIFVVRVRSRAGTCCALLPSIHVGAIICFYSESERNASSSS